MIPKIEFLDPALFPKVGHERFIVYRKNGQAYLAELLLTELKITEIDAPADALALATSIAAKRLDKLLPEGYTFPEFVLDLAASEEEE